MQNIFVAGGAGFIGSHLCDALLSDGNRVVCLDNFLRGSEANLKIASEDPRFCLIPGDASDIVLVSRILKEYEITHVFHLAANSDIRASAIDPGIEFAMTLSPTWSLLCAMRETGVKKMFFASTSAIYGDRCGELLNENDPSAPVSYYGAAKTGSEAMISAFSHMDDMDICVFRFANVIGPRLTHGVIYDFIHKLSSDPTHLDVLGNGTQTKPYIYIDDLIRAILMMYDRVSGAEFFNVGVESRTAVSRIAEIVLREMDLSQTPINYGSEDIGWKGDIHDFSFDLGKIHQTGWRAELTSDEAVCRTVREMLRCRQ